MSTTTLPTYEEATAKPARHGKVITVTSARTGSGKNTVALCLGVAIHRASPAVAEGKEPLRVCVVDLDNIDGQLGLLLGTQAPHTLSLYVAASTGDGVTSSTVMNSLSYYEDLGIYALIAPKRAIEAAVIPADFYASILEVLREEFDVIVLVGASNSLDEVFREVALPEADNILYIANSSPDSVQSMNLWLEEVTSTEGVGIQGDKISILLNQSVEELEEDAPVGPFEGVSVAGTLPLSPETVIASRASLDSALTGDTPYAKAYESLAKHLLPR